MKTSRTRLGWRRVVVAGWVFLSGVCAARGDDGVIIRALAPEKPAAGEPLASSREAPPPACAPAPPLFRPEEAFPPGVEVLRIDLVTALRLADASNPTIALARVRVEEAYAHLQEAQVLWLPNLDATPGYLRHDGEIQNAAGVVFQTNKSAVFALGGPVLQVNTGDALFAPLVARRLADAQRAAADAVNNNIQLSVALAYLDLLQVYGQLAVNADLLARDREVLRLATEVKKAELFKTGADINRARTEVELRLQDRIALSGQLRVASSRLARLLLLQPTVALIPSDPALVPVTLVPEDGPLEKLVDVGLTTRPELTEGRALVAASEAGLRQAQLSPLLPTLQVSYEAGGFGGGQKEFIGHFNGRGDGTALAVWELRNLGLGNLAQNRVRRAQVSEANLHVVEVQAQVADEVVSAAQVARARREALDSAQKAVSEAVEMYRKLDLIAFGMTGPRKEFDSLEPLLAVQALAQSRFQYLNTVIDYNRAQFQLFTALGKPSIEALAKAIPTAVEVPTTPPPYQPLPADKRP